MIGGPAPGDRADGESLAVPKIRILGEVEVLGTGDWPTAKSQELVVYLATSRGGVEAPRLMEALWPREEHNLNRLRTEVSRARQVLGEDPEGRPYLPPPNNGVYRLDPRIRTDYDEFRQLVSDAIQRPADAIQLLRSALDLVEDRPWSGTPERCYAWASYQAHTIEQAVADAAHRLARLHLDRGESSEAAQAARDGLVADAFYEALHRDLMEAAAADGNTAQVRTIMDQFRQLLYEETGANDADDWMDPETIHLYEQLTRDRQPR